VGDEQSWPPPDAQVLPPSIHPSGVEYQFEKLINSELPLIDIEEVLGLDSSTQENKRGAASENAPSEAEEEFIEDWQGTYIKQLRQLTVAIWLRHWLDSYVASNLAPKTGESYKHELGNYVIPHLGGIRLGELRPHHIRDFLRRRE